MRLVCPNCDAKYEVPEDAIPDAGRDVQCANCSHAWFQARERTASTVVTKRSEPNPQPVASPAARPETPQTSASDAPAPVGIAVEPETPAARAVPTSKSKADTAVKAASKALPPSAEANQPQSEPATASSTPEGMPSASEAESATSEPEGAIADSSSKPAPRIGAWPEMAEEAEVAQPIAAREVDEGVLTILREEAEREVKARFFERQSPESGPDLGVEAAPAARKKVAGKKPAPVPEEVAKPSARRDLLPDVEEINSTLRRSEISEAESAGDMDMAGRDGRGAFRSGFLLVLSMAILGAAVYIASAWLANLIPALEGPLKSYVGLIDGIRLNMDSLMQSATRLISGEPD